MRVLNMRDEEAQRLLAEGKAEYVGRGYARQDLLSRLYCEKGWLGNPHVVGWCEHCKTYHEQGEAAEAYRNNLEWRYEFDERFAKAFSEMMKTREALVCWCAPRRCHGNVIIEFWEDITRNRKEL
jgi:hypothetical protein